VGELGSERSPGGEEEEEGNHPSLSCSWCFGLNHRLPSGLQSRLSETSLILTCKNSWAGLRTS